MDQGLTLYTWMPGYSRSICCCNCPSKCSYMLLFTKLSLLGAKHHFLFKYHQFFVSSCRRACLYSPRIIYPNHLLYRVTSVIVSTHYISQPLIISSHICHRVSLWFSVDCCVQSFCSVHTMIITYLINMCNFLVSLTWFLHVL